MTTLDYTAYPDPDLEQYWLALADKAFNKDETSFDYLKDCYLRLNDKWRNEMLKALWVFRDELDENQLNWNTFNNLSDNFDINPNSITTLEIDQLFEWVNN